ncbi:putative lipoprotein [Leptospira interrogans str. FPW1039]|uniref:Putative lipoprotein n=1 Tax=Leptospira interrogans str. FPW1039 TaxID=1193040 RepID=A0A0F6IDE8_LEPIR|nr:putative lipoprotein [Leptospira interrogans serovar Pomona str. Kennewicki LC82-25]EKN98088.1 putative lipoprotein [Leptospira interrogans serovar Pomona str. Pomona]EMF31667.1 putative lipoprotein [Leptospira interrogans serovar Pomona str. Fox 32256]EMI68161.1 putative lipoprotein [Leptospira interrogans serovar Pomona str. CSL10083]EMJ36073.1 putative lipoprotein [Leptospira interrogans str. FPW1039]EMJ60416.1 putative lipoprotein [Leptospira interrogans serovar Pomona str. CSL4002]
MKHETFLSGLYLNQISFSCKRGGLSKDDLFKKRELGVKNS